MLALVVGGGVALFVGRRDRPAARTAAAPTVIKPLRHTTPLHLVARSAGSLAAPVQDAAGAALKQGSVLLLGGLTAADVSTSAMRVVSAGRDQALGRLPVALHDAAAARLGRFVYLFGGGDGTAQHREIVRVDPVSGLTQQAGSLPAGSSDQAAAAIAGTAYVVGGFDGSRWLDTVVAWRPGRSARIVAHLPDPVRYAAVTAVGSALVVAGGSLPDGQASDSVYLLRAGSSRPVRIGRLPAPTTHASAATVDGQAVIVGGRGTSTGTPTSRVVAIDVRRRTIRAAGSLGDPLSDATVVTIGSRILVAGGRTVRGTVRRLRWLAQGRQIAHARTRATTNVYAADGVNMLSGAAALALPRIYVPNSESGTVDVIDPATRRVVGHFAVGLLPQHVTPSYDLKTLYVLNDVGNSVTPIDPQTAKPGTPIPVDDPYNMYFTPDGRWAIVVAERLHRLDFRDAHTFKLHHSLPVPCAGVDHVDFSADGSYLIASCEFSGQVLKVDVAGERVVDVLHLPRGGMPQDVKLSPDGRVFYVADMLANGLWEIDGARLKMIGFLPTGRGVHGLYPSRDARYLFATNRGEGSISVISFRTRKVLKKWRIPGGGSPDMGGVSADGKTLWLSGRYNAEVYALSTRTGRLLARIPVGRGPHGLCVWPQPGRYSLGHTGILR
jgi:YVTN family beta-propeller protein